MLVTLHSQLVHSSPVKSLVVQGKPRTTMAIGSSCRKRGNTPDHQHTYRTEIKFIMKNSIITLGAGMTVAFACAVLAGTTESVDDDVIVMQRTNLASSTKGLGFGPQSPRDIDSTDGMNDRIFQPAPPHTEMNLCNIHMHEGAEHKGGEFTKYAGNGDGKGYGTGFLYSGELSDDELKPMDMAIGMGEHGSLEPGDTIEVHYVHTTAQVKPGPTLGACLSDAIKNPQLRVETQVFVVVNDDSAHDFQALTDVSEIDGKYQAPNIPTDTGEPIQYEGSTTGPGYNEAGSPFQVSWSVRPKVAKVNLATVGAWFESNLFDENHAHGVRNLVQNTSLLAPIGN